jgi:hypothetical protein
MASSFEANTNGSILTGVAVRPRIAKEFEVQTTNVLVVMAKIAGMESTANMTSVVSTLARSVAPILRLPSWSWRLSSYYALVS